MNLWFFSTKPNRPRQRAAPSVRLFLESLEDRCLPSANPMMPMATSPPPAAVNTIASLPHEQIHVFQDQFHQQTQLAALRLEVEQVVLGLLQEFAPQVPRFQPLIASLTSAIPMQQATVQMLQNQSNLLDQLDDLQDQSLILGTVIQNGAALIPLLQQSGKGQAANALQNTVAADQVAVQALQPQITLVEQEVSTFV